MDSSERIFNIYYDRKKLLTFYAFARLRCRVHLISSLHMLPRCVFLYAHIIGTTHHCLGFFSATFPRSYYVRLSCKLIRQFSICIPSSTRQISTSNHRRLDIPRDLPLVLDRLRSRNKSGSWRIKKTLKNGTIPLISPVVRLLL